MRRIGFPSAAGIWICLTTLVLPSGLWAQTDPAKVFKTNCSLCHSDDGSGNSPTGKAMKAKDLRSSEVADKTDAQLAEVITKGRGKMPAFGAKMRPDGVTQLVAYIRSLKK
ncbi:MAG TPA: cytochrome c [Candidatus Acidoferrum sp.]|nr:cytochrome c [Candidatus Acidoferrum sp.]